MADTTKCRTNGLSGPLGLRRNSPHYKNVYSWTGKKNTGTKNVTESEADVRRHRWPRTSKIVPCELNEKNAPWWA